MSRSDEIVELCEAHGCSEKARKIHFDQYVKQQWHPHPPADFLAWWIPFDKDLESGASVGGHPESLRVHARKDPDGWKHGVFGVPAKIAWNSDEFRQEFLIWQSVGSPARPEEYVSIAASLERQKQFWHDLKPVIDKIGKPIPIVDEGAIALEAGVTRSMPDP